MKHQAVVIGRWFALGLLSLFVLPACGGGSRTSTASGGLLWNSTSGTGGGNGAAPTPGMLLWVDPNSGLGGGTIGQLVGSSDDITYSMPVVYIAGNTHPLMVSTSSRTIKDAEEGLMQALNGYRSQQLGGGGGLGGGGFGNGGVVAPPTNAFLQGHEGLTRNARADCKHFALYHPGPFEETNPEGDRANSGGVAPAGRLAKSKITVAAGASVELRVAGPGYTDFSAAAAYLTANYSAALVDLKWTHIGAGYWNAGSEEHYWCVILARSPIP